jgi:hypothetical protein
VRSHGPVSFPLQSPSLGREATSPGQSYFVYFLLCVFLNFCYPFRTRTLLNYLVTPPIRPFLPLVRYFAFLHSPSVIPNASSGAPSSFAFGPANQRTACKYRISTSSAGGGSVIDIIPRLDPNLLLCWTHFKFSGRSSQYFPPLCCPSDTRQTHLRNWSEVPFFSSTL